MEIVGRLTADAECKTTKSGKQVVNFSVAVNDTYRVKGAEQPTKVTTYFNCSYWKSTGIAEYMRKGATVQVTGRVSVRAWTNTQGEAKAALNLHANEIRLHGKPERKPLPTPEQITEPIDDLPF